MLPDLLSRARRAHITACIAALVSVLACAACAGNTVSDPTPGSDPAEEPSPTSCGGASAPGARVSDGTFRTADGAKTLVVDRRANSVTRTYVDAAGKKVVERWAIR